MRRRQRDLEIAVVHRAERDDARRVAQLELGEPAEGDVDGIEPQDVVGTLAAADEAELRAHDAGQHVHAPAAARRALRLRVVRARELRQLRVQLGAEIFDQPFVARRRREQRDERGLIERQPVVGRDVIRGRAGLPASGSLMRGTPSLPSIQSRTAATAHHAELIAAGLRTKDIFVVLVVEHRGGNAGGDPHELLQLLDRAATGTHCADEKKPSSMSTFSCSISRTASLMATSGLL